MGTEVKGNVALLGTKLGRLESAVRRFGVYPLDWAADAADNRSRFGER
jgi:hypothetical protein